MRAQLRRTLLIPLDTAFSAGLVSFTISTVGTLKIHIVLACLQTFIPQKIRLSVGFCLSVWKTKAQVNCKYRAVGCHVIQIGHAICPKAMKKKVTPFAGHIVYLSHPSRPFQWQITTRKLIPTVPAYRGHIPTEPLLCAAIATGYLKIAGWQLVTDRLCCSRAHLVC